MIMTKLFCLDRGGGGDATGTEGIGGEEGCGSGFSISKISITYLEMFVNSCSKLTIRVKLAHGFIQI